MSNIRLGLREEARESREFVRMCSATNGGRISAAVSGKFAFHASRSLARLFVERKKCREQIGRSSARESTSNPSCNYDSASRCHGGSVGVVSWTLDDLALTRVGWARSGDGACTARARATATADDLLRLLEGGEDWVNKYDVDDDWDCARGRQTYEPDRS